MARMRGSLDFAARITTPKRAWTRRWAGGRGVERTPRAEVGGVAEADQAAKAQDESEADRRDREDHDPPEQIEIEGLVGQRGDHGHEAERQQAGHQRERARPGAHQPRTAGNNPWGRKKRTAAIRM